MAPLRVSLLKLFVKNTDARIIWVNLVCLFSIFEEKNLLVVVPSPPPERGIDFNRILFKIKGGPKNHNRLYIKFLISKLLSPDIRKSKYGPTIYQ